MTTTQEPPTATEAPLLLAPPVRVPHVEVSPLREAVRDLVGSALVEPEPEPEPEPVINVALLRGVLLYLTNHPFRHRQGTWGWRHENRFLAALRVLPMGQECGTRACLAGWTVILTGHARWRQGSPRGDQTLYGTDPKTGALVEPAPAARQLLGLTYDQAAELFDGSRKLAGLWISAARMTGGRVFWRNS